MVIPVPHRVTTVSALTSAEADSVLVLADAAAAADRIGPLNDDALLSLTPTFGRPTTPVTHLLVREPGGTLSGYAQLDFSHTAQLVVAPNRRRQGIGAALTSTIQAMDPTARFWAFGHLAAAKTFAQHQGFAPARELLQMTRDLRLRPPAPAAAALPVRIRPYQASDTDAILTVNSLAFSSHPEQGRWTRADLNARLAASWFDPQGLLLAEDLTTGSVLGFHWTKIHEAPGREPVGEVYVLAVLPRCARQGLGRALLEAGVDYLSSVGLRYVILYVEGSNERVVRLYDGSGFWVSRRDVLYSPTSVPAPPAAPSAAPTTDARAAPAQPAWPATTNGSSTAQPTPAPQPPTPPPTPPTPQPSTWPTTT
ncbi:MAG: mycothiol synthase, partial [Propionibacteriaceae bacterium]|nr:mycothiol synthase [Propionibacteriaceae bacterium]